MKPLKIVIPIVLVLLGAAHLVASGPVGLYGIVEKVVFEPNEQSPERVQVWGAFAYADGRVGHELTISSAKRGYLYFKLPAETSGFGSPSQLSTVRNEWADLKAVAATGQAIAFGEWGYVGAFEGLQPDTRSTSGPPFIFERVGPNRAGPTSRSGPTDLRVRPASEAPASPATYQTNAGIVKLTASGSHAAIVKALKEALARS